MCHEILARFQLSYSKDQQKKSLARQNTHDVSIIKGQINALVIVALDIVIILRIVIGNDYRDANFFIQVIPGIIISWILFYILLDKNKYYENQFIKEFEKISIGDKLSKYLLVSFIYIIVPIFIYILF